MPILDASEAGIKREPDVAYTKPVARFDARCLDCTFTTGYRRGAAAVTKGEAHKAVEQHDVEIYAESLVEVLRAEKKRFDPRRSE